MDGHHANTAGEYLGACVWFEVLFGESVVGNAFVTPGLDKTYARFLQETAHKTVEASRSYEKAWQFAEQLIELTDEGGQEPRERASSSSFHAQSIPAPSIPLTRGSKPRRPVAGSGKSTA